MAAYWWQCQYCDHSIDDFKKVCGVKSITFFIRDLLSLEWNQKLLILDCPKCGKHSLRITYKFPRKDNDDIIQVLNIIGISPLPDDLPYLPMMWKTFFKNNPKEHWYDFKYIRNRNMWGLNKPAVFRQKDLQKLFELYCDITGEKYFP